MEEIYTQRYLHFSQRTGKNTKRVNGERSMYHNCNYIESSYTHMTSLAKLGIILKVYIFSVSMNGVNKNRKLVIIKFAAKDRSL